MQISQRFGKMKKNNYTNKFFKKEADSYKKPASFLKNQQNNNNFSIYSKYINLF